MAWQEGKIDWKAQARAGQGMKRYGMTKQEQGKIQRGTGQWQGQWQDRGKCRTGAGTWPGTGTGQDRTGQDRTGQGRAGAWVECRTGQESLCIG